MPPTLQPGGWSAGVVGMGVVVEVADGEVGSSLALTYKRRLRYETGAVCSPWRLQLLLGACREDEIDAPVSQSAPGFFTVCC